MRKLILQLAVSLDGFIEGPNGEFDWCFTDQDYGMKEFFKRIDAVFFGRKSYEVAMSIPDNAGWMPPVKQYIFSNTLTSVEQPAELVQGDTISKVTSIKSQPGKDIWLFGGASLTKSLLEAKLVDELILAVHPILLGNGKRLFQDITDRINLKLLHTKEYSSGLVMLSYGLKK
ncbi:MAG: dihydrofolate reductase [Chitinophagaceae bacterium]|nr:dihydrofolate reductase [Chitinophagaceae bacterium]